MPEQDLSLNSLEDVLAAMKAASAENREILIRLRDWLTGLIDLELAPEEALERIRPGRDALTRVIDGEATEPQSVLTGAAEAVEQGVQISARLEAEEAQSEGEAAGRGSAPTPDVSAQAVPRPAPPAAAPTAGELMEGFATVLPADSDDELLHEYIAESLDHISASEAALLDLEAQPEDSESLNTVFRAFHTIKGTSGFLGLDLAKEMAHKAETILSRARDGEIRLTGGYADLALESCDVLKEMTQAMDGINPGDALVIPKNYADILARLNDPESSVDTASESSGMTAPAAQIPAVAQAASAVAPAGAAVDSAQNAQAASGAPQPARHAGKASESTIRVSTGRLDSLINMVGELVIAHSMVSQDPEVVSGANPRLAKSVSHSSKIVRELQDLSMALRMVPLKGTFQKMNRLVRDLARKSGKSVQFQTEGEDTEIDRNMVEVLNDPLVHMIRNAVDHGIESTDDRREAGKAEVGSVHLRAYQTAGNVAIELRDDGKGLDREKIIAKAVDRGLISSGESLSDSEAFALVFQPGFSTAEVVTDVSGRGVGMDVVKRSIESLRGRIQVTSKPGEGSVFTLHLPLTMAITDAMFVQVGDERYLIPTVSIEQSFRPGDETLFTVEGRGEVVMLRNEIIPIVRLAHLFGVTGAREELSGGLLIAVEAEGKRCTLMVDDLLGQHQVVIKSLGEGLGEIAGVSGGTILGDGRVGLILDVPGILKMAQAGTTTRSGRAAGAAKAQSEPQETLRSA